MDKLENTPDNKARFFGLYYSQRVLIPSVNTDTIPVSHWQSIVHYPHFKESTLLLTPLSQISDEDVKGLTNSFMRTKKELLDYYCSESNGQALKMLFKDLKPEDYDYLRSKGYALPWMGLSVDDLVSYGWVKLKGGQPWMS